MNKLAEQRRGRPAVSLEELIPVKRRLIPLSAMNANSHGTAKRGEKRY